MVDGVWVGKGVNARAYERRKTAPRYRSGAGHDHGPPLATRRLPRLPLADPRLSPRLSPRVARRPQRCAALHLHAYTLFSRRSLICLRRCSLSRSSFWMLSRVDGLRAPDDGGVPRPPGLSSSGIMFGEGECRSAPAGGLARCGVSAVTRFGHVAIHGSARAPCGRIDMKSDRVTAVEVGELRRDQSHLRG